MFNSIISLVCFILLGGIVFALIDFGIPIDVIVKGAITSFMIVLIIVIAYWTM